jgi:hypothetical protein
VKRKETVLLPISLILIACLAIPVSAFYFDFQYFETDKLVYEVGETVDMVAKLIADFSNDGWCYVSFAVVTDLGPSFADEYFIPPSPFVRYLNSSYTILPEHTSPSVTGVQAFVLFTVEIFDTVSQSAGDNIQITINRGHLTTIPLSSLSVQFGSNTSIPLKIASVHNDNVIYSGETVSIHVENSTSQTVLQTNTTTTPTGMVYLNWSESFGPPGLYSLTVSSAGNDDFLPFTDSFQVTVLPAMSNLSIVSSPDSVYCQSPDATHIEQAEIIVEHSDLASNPIDGSTVDWVSSFGSGVLVSFGNGQYSNMIPFNTSPGTYHINFTAVNSQYQIVETSAIIEVLPNSLQLSPIQPYWNASRGDNVTIEFLLESTLDWNQSIQLEFTDTAFQFSVISDFYLDIYNFLDLSIWHNISVGIHTINITSVSENYQLSTLSQIDLHVFGTIEANVSVETIYYGETMEFNLAIMDDNNQTVSWVDIAIFCDDITSPFALTDYVNSSDVQVTPLPMWISPGFHNITFTISSQYYETINYTMTVKVWMPTNITIIITTSDNEQDGQTAMIVMPHDFSITRRISSGVIMRPPPILFKGTTSTIPFTARLTSLDN